MHRFLCMHLTCARTKSAEIVLQIHGVQDMFGGMFGQGLKAGENKQSMERIPTKHANGCSSWASGCSSWEIVHRTVHVHFNALNFEDLQKPWQ